MAFSPTAAAQSFHREGLVLLASYYYFKVYEVSLQSLIFSITVTVTVCYLSVSFLCLYSSVSVHQISPDAFLPHSQFIFSVLPC